LPAGRGKVLVAILPQSQPTLFVTRTITYTYDTLNRLVDADYRSTGLTAGSTDEIFEYTYDATGNRILAEETISGTTLYLYPSATLGAGGRDCLGEFRDGEPALSGAEGWLYYLPDAEGLVRQGLDAQGDLVSAWLFDPDGALLEGPDGPVSHLVCGGVYDQSTGLLYKGGRYFDPSLGIWLALLPLIVVRRKKKRRGFPWVVALALCLGGMSGVLTACGPGATLTILNSKQVKDPHLMVGVFFVGGCRLIQAVYNSQ